MTDAEKAYAAAERLIEQTKAAGWDALSFDKDEFRALEVLPDSLSDLTNLESLSLSNTQMVEIAPLQALTNLTQLYLSNIQVADVTPLQGLTKLTDLILNGTEVADLRPVIGLSQLAEAPSRFGLSFINTRATQIDPKIAEISAIEDDATRAKTLFDYLQDWQPPDEEEAPTEPKQRKTGASYRIGGNGKVGNGEEDDLASDPDLTELHALLREDVDTLLGTSGGGHNNQHAQFHNLLNRYQAALGLSVSTLKTLRFWNEGNKLRRELDSTQSRSDDDLDGPPPLSAELEDGLHAMVALHNSFCAQHPKLQAFDRNRFDPLRVSEIEDQRQHAGQLVRQIETQSEVVETEVREDLAELSRAAEGDSAEAQRALQVEKDSLENFLSVTAAWLVKQIKTGGTFAATLCVTELALKGGTAETPFIAKTIAELILYLGPYANSALACWHGTEYPLIQTLNWIKAKLQELSEQPSEQE